MDPERAATRGVVPRVAVGDGGAGRSRFWEGIPGPEEPHRDREDLPGWTGLADGSGQRRLGGYGGPKISSAGLTRRRCQKPNPERISMTPARTKLTTAPIRAIWPSSQKA